jgi:UDP-N-acetylmuramoylalanine-D-glutamate ligase
MRRIAESPHPVLYSEGTSASQQYNLFEDRLDALKELVRRLKDTS